jgi:hypothetical protein
MERKNWKFKSKPGVVVHTCIPSYLGGKDWENFGSRPAQAKN